MFFLHFGGFLNDNIMCLKYEIVRADSLENLAVEINKRLKNEWQLNGGVISTCDKKFPFAQAMTTCDSHLMPVDFQNEPDKIGKESWWHNPKN